MRSGMNKFLEDACEEVDACVFSGDSLFDPDNRAEFRKYLERWLRAINERESTDDDLI